VFLRSKTIRKDKNAKETINLEITPLKLKNPLNLKPKPMQIIEEIKEIKNPDDEI
jgi:hypothetical protein